MHCPAAGGPFQQTRGTALRRKLWLCLALPLVTALMTLALACGDDDREEDGGEATAMPTATVEAGGDESEVEDTVEQMAGAGPEDVEFFLGHVTDAFLENYVGMTREECRQNAQDCVGDPGSAGSLQNTQVTGDKATTEAQFVFGEDTEENQVHLVREDGDWKIDDLRAVPRDIPEGVKRVSLALDEFSFEFDPEAVKGGDFAFEVHNAGGQRHEVRVAKIPADLDLEAAVTSEDQPEGVEDIAYQGPFAPGDEGSVVFDEPLTPGRYALVCFLPDKDDPEETPHAIKGMFADFTVE